MQIKSRKLSTFWLPALIFLLAFALRAYHLGAQSLFLDEAWSWAASQLPGKGIAVLLAHDPHPVLYYFVLKGMLAIIPDSEAGLRVPSLIFSLASIAVLLWIAPRWFGRRAALFAGFLAAISSFDIYYAQEARMYTMLAFLWMASFFALLAAFDGQRWGFILWGAANLSLAWAHFYGVLVVAVHLGLAAFLGARSVRNARDETPSFSLRFFFWGTGISLLALLSVAPLLWHYKSGGAGGAWIPTWMDGVSLWGLFSSGLPAARTHFLNGSSLVVSPLLWLPPLGWSLLGVALLGPLIIWGGIVARKVPLASRRVWLAAALSAGLPIVVTFFYAALFHRAMWAYKPFIGAMYLIFLLAGFGFAHLEEAAFRGVIVGSFAVLAVLALFPYYTQWQKSDARRAFQSVPQSGNLDAILLERPYLAPLAWYYLGADTPLLGINAYDPQDASLVALQFGDTLLTRPREVSCEEIRHTQTLWIYGFPPRVRSSYRAWPNCILQKDRYLFDAARWMPLTP